MCECLCVCVCVSGKAGSAVTVAGICPAIDRDRGRKARERKQENLEGFTDLRAGPPKRHCLQVKMRNVCVHVCVSPGMHFFARNMYGIVGITGTGKLDGRLFGVTPVLDLAMSLLRDGNL